MKGLLGIGISVGVLAGVWTFASVELTLLTWVGFVAWACFFAAGGGTTGVTKAGAALVAGVFWGWVVSQGLTTISSSTIALSLMIVVIGFILCVEAALPLLSFIPGGFVGAGVFFGSGFDLSGVLVAIVAGCALGFVSEKLAGVIQNSITGPAAATAEPAAA